MADAIIANQEIYTKQNSSIIINQNLHDKEVCMQRPSLIIKDAIKAKSRIKKPLKFHWLKFKTSFFGLVIKKGGVGA